MISKGSCDMKTRVMADKKIFYVKFFNEIDWTLWSIRDFLQKLKYAQNLTGGVSKYVYSLYRLTSLSESMFWNYKW